MYYNKETQVMVNNLVNDFYTRFILKIDSLPHNLVLLLDISKTFFNNLRPEFTEFLIL